MKFARTRVFAALLVGLALVACTKVGTAPSDGGTGAAGGNPWTQHGVLRMANLSEPDTLNPVIGNQQIDSDLAMFWGGFFFNFNDQSQFVPELAIELPTLANHEISPDGKTITYHLRRNVLWHDGKPFTADDVIFTWHAIMNPNNNVGSTVGYDLISRIDKLDAYGIRVHLKSAWSPFVATFFNQSGNPYPVLPAHLLASYPNINKLEYNSQPIGTGPFVVERWQRGSKITFVANPHYWRGPPKLKKIEYTPVPNENTIVTLLQSHEIDLEYNATSNNYVQVSHIPGTRVVLTPFNQYGQLGLNTSTPVLSDVNVRRAMWYALDSPAIIKDISHDVNQVGYTDQPAFSWAYNPNVTHYPFDLPKAKALLEAAGWKLGSDGVRVKNGLRLSIALTGVAGSASGTAVAVAAQHYWKEAGIEALVKNYPSSLYFASFGAGGILQTGKFDAGFYSWVAGTDPDDSTLFMCDQIPRAGQSGQNVYHFCNHELDAAEKAALASNDRAVRKAAYDKIQAILADQVPLIVNWYNRRIAVMNTDFKNYKPGHAVNTFWNSWDWEI
jgi:peptide/nickel transport system substrate-binding protein